MKQRFFKCAHCGNIIAFVKDKGVPVMCCGEKMQELIPGTVEASREKHIPVVEQKGIAVTVTVGSVPHPMAEDHYIEWISIQTKNGNQRHEFRPGDAPVAHFALVEGDALEVAFAYCNLHGLWKAE